MPCRTRYAERSWPWGRRGQEAGGGGRYASSMGRPNRLARLGFVTACMRAQWTGWTAAALDVTGTYLLMRPVLVSHTSTSDQDGRSWHLVSTVPVPRHHRGHRDPRRRRISPAGTGIGHAPALSCIASTPRLHSEQKAARFGLSLRCPCLCAPPCRLQYYSPDCSRELRIRPLAPIHYKVGFRGWRDLPRVCLLTLCANLRGV